MSREQNHRRTCLEALADPPSSGPGRRGTDPCRGMPRMDEPNEGKRMNESRAWWWKKWIGADGGGVWQGGCTVSSHPILLGWLTRSDLYLLPFVARARTSSPYRPPRRAIPPSIPPALPSSNRAPPHFRRSHRSSWEPLTFVFVSGPLSLDPCFSLSLLRLLLLPPQSLRRSPLFYHSLS